MTEPAPPAGPRRVLLLITVLVVAANLRPVITVVGPLIEQIGADTGLSPAALGLLGSVPVLSFAVVSPFVQRAAARWGMERTIFFSLLLLAAGTVLRSLAEHLGMVAEMPLFAGTVLLSVAIGVGNVLVPAVVKRDFPDRVPQMTGLYTAVLVGSAAVASGLAVPLAGGIGWELTLGGGAVLALLTAALWTLRLRHRTPDDGGSCSGVPASAPVPMRSMWRSPLAWQVTLYFGLQSSVFYTMLTWFPAVQTYQGIGEAAAGWLLATYQAVGIVASLLVGQVMQRRGDHRAVSCALGLMMGGGILGMALAPALMPFWALVAGFASGASLMASLTLISERAPSPRLAGQLSGMAQGVGYLLAALGPVAAGSVFQVAGSWTPVLIGVAVVGCLQAIVGLSAGRDLRTH